MNITENKLIAEFMGFQETKIGYYDYEEVLTLPYTFDNTFDYLLFDKSWDWLMPVVERIETIDRGDEKGKFLLHFNSNSVNWNNTPPTITGINKRHATYKAVVKFIKWYNENKED